MALRLNSIISRRLGAREYSLSDAIKLLSIGQFSKFSLNSVQRLSPAFSKDPRMGMMFQPRRFKGHAHWQNIMHTKQKTDIMKSQVTSRLMTRLKSAVWHNNGETNPKFNKALANVLEECAVNNVPKETIKRNLDRVMNAPPAQIHRFDIFGRNGVFLLVEIETATKGKTRNLLQKLCQKLGDFGVIDRAPGEGFQTQGIIRIFKDSAAAKDATGGDPELESSKIAAAEVLTFSDAETLAIELECEEVREVEPDEKEETPAMFEFVCAPENIDRVSSGLRVRGYTVQSSDVDFLPYPAPVKIPPQMEKSVNSLYSQLEQLEGIGRIFDNIAWEDEES